MSYTSAIIVAGGMGTRVGSLDVPKQFYMLGDKAVLYHATVPFQQSPLINEIIIVTLPDYVELCRKKLAGLTKVKKVTVGGNTRQQSVFNGVDEVSPDCGLIVVHDGARPFVTENDISAVVMGAGSSRAAAVGIQVSDTIKSVNPKGFVEGSLERGRLWAVQTPQAVPYDIFAKARKRAENEKINVTDDVSLAELLDYPVKIIEGSADNIKITYERDLLLAQLIAERRRTVKE